MSGKVKLRKAKISPNMSGCSSVDSMLPYFRSSQPNNKFYHKIRSSIAHWRNGRLSHISITFECGNGGFLKKGNVYAYIPEGGVMCKRCRGDVDNSWISGLIYL